MAAADYQQARAARRKVKRAASLLRDAGRDLARTLDADIVAAAEATTEQEAAQAAQLVRVAFAEAPGPVEVLVLSHPPTPPHNTTAPHVGAKETP